MKLSALTLLTLTGWVNAMAFTSTQRYGDCWTAVSAGYTTKSVPVTTATIHDPGVRTLTAVEWIYPTELPKRSEPEPEKTTIYVTNECTNTRTAYVTSTMTETVPTLTASTTKYASTTLVTATSTCADWDC
ncbi:hypothetical protein M408DRAFT_26255 [Serendipita vermifera MAFF 305830]|uniref:Uncharacterized protein n=1 Tax=Serendipita vermifera MAFF 305830 TaxID=933852 RepID=A0A0C2WGD9_SERVB|nr:hypothetical protein M408DRAFT_26255 [Serendipita vermifera MAFF 305830]